VDRFSGALRFATVSPDPHRDFSIQPFLDLHDYLETAFPLVHERLSRELIGDGSLLFTWPGTDPGSPPIILLAHQDVVPVEEATAEAWDHPPFGGEVADGFVWSRGAVDDKSSLVAILEAVETLLEEGFAPAHTVYLVFGHDEEIGGAGGAKKVAGLMAERGIRASYALDEGSAIVQGVFPGVEEPVALIGLAEKGYLSLELVASAVGGHSSTPQRETAIDILARAILALEDSPFPSHLEGPTGMLFRSLAPRMSFGARMVFGNLWLLGAPVRWALSLNPETNAAIRTTVAPTLLSSGITDNVIPEEARAVVNLRIIPGETTESAWSYVRRVVDDPRVSVRIEKGGHSDPTRVSSVDSEGYRRLEDAVTETFPGTVVAPFLSLGGTDSKYFEEVAEDVYRFAPDHYAPDQGVHGVNERIRIESYLDMVRFYVHLLETPGIQR
jgi:carboxypeptidase PM20D1